MTGGLEPGAADRCTTCGDLAEPMTVVRVDAGRGLALCATAAGERRTVETALVEPVAAGDALLVHAGTAIARMDEARPAADRGIPGREAAHPARDRGIPGREAAHPARDRGIPGREAEEMPR